MLLYCHAVVLLCCYTDVTAAAAAILRRLVLPLVLFDLTCADVEKDLCLIPGPDSGRFPWWVMVGSG